MTFYSEKTSFQNFLIRPFWKCFMYLLQFSVKIAPFITAHNCNIYAHTEVFIYSHDLKLFSGHHPWPEQEQCHPDSPHHCWMAACAVRGASLTGPTHAHKPGGHSTISTSMHTSETFNTNKSHAHQRQPGRGEILSFGVRKTACVLSSLSFSQEDVLHPAS